MPALKLSLPIKNRGILLLEVLITVTVLGIALVIILQAFSASMRAIRTAQQVTHASLLAEEKLSQLKQKSVQEDGVSVGQESGQFFEENKEFSWQSDITSLEDLAINQAEVKVSWQQRDRQNQVSLITYLRAKESTE